MDLQLYINNSLIDIDSSTIAPLTYSIADIKSPNKRSRNRSKTVTIKGTQNNLRVLYPTYNLSLEDTGTGFDFNPNSELSVRVIRNGYIIFNGIANFMAAKLNKGVWSFDFMFVGNTISLFERLGEMTLAELGWDEYNHAMTVANIVLSWNTSVVVNGTPTSNFTGVVPNGFGYVYPLINYGYSADQTKPRTRDILPLVYFKEVFEKCFAIGGYTVIGNWINTNAVKRIIIGNAAGERVEVTQAEIDERQVEYSVAGSFGATVLASFDQTQITRDIYFTIISQQVFCGDIGTLTTTLVNDDRLQFDEVTGIITVQSAGNYNLAFDINCDFTPASTASQSSNMAYNMQIVAIVNNVTSGLQSASLTVGTGFVGGGTFDRYLNAGDEIRFSLIVSGQGYSYNDIGDPIPEVSFVLDINTASFDVTSLDLELTEGDTIYLSKYLPNMTCREFLNSAIVATNLYISDANDDNEVRVEPFGDYYLGTDEAENWTMLLDYEKEVNIKTNAGTEGKVYRFRFAEDRDLYKKMYFEKWGEDYGDLNLTIPTTFVKGEKVFQVGFAQTIPIQVGDLVIPQIVTRNENTLVEAPYKGKPRIFIYNGLKIGAFKLRNTSTLAATSYTSYPQAHHVNNVDTPTFDLNFGVPIEIYYDTLAYTTTNLFSSHYDTFIKELTSQDSKLLTAYFKINERDLQGEFMRRLVNINGVIYRKNLISDFDATGYETTKVELVKVLDADSRAAVTPPRTVPAKNLILGVKNLPVSKKKIIDTTYTFNAGDENYLWCDTSGGDFTITLSNDMRDGMEVTIYQYGGFNVRVRAESGNISGNASITYTADYESKTFIFIENETANKWSLKNN